MSGRQICIVCSARSHEPRIVKIARFGWHGGGWGEVFPHWPKGKPHRGGLAHASLNIQLTGTRLEDNNPVVPDWEKEKDPSTDDGRYRYRIECKLCGDSVTIRAEKLEPLLDRAASAGVSELPLTILRS